MVHATPKSDWHTRRPSHRPWLWAVAAGLVAVSSVFGHADDAAASATKRARSSVTQLRQRHQQGLARVDQIFKQLGITAESRSYAHGPMGGLTSLTSAYHQGRAINVRGTTEEVRYWMALGKFSHQGPSEDGTRGPLTPYDVIVIRGAGDSAWIHVVLPKDGRVLREGRGKHIALIGGRPWVALADYLEVGREYIPFKRNGKPALHRQWGRLDIVREIADLARDYLQQTGSPLGIGDISHVTGGAISDHLTHELGEDVDFYLLNFDSGRAHMMWHTEAPEGAYWSDERNGAGLIEEPDPVSGHTQSDRNLLTLARLALANDRIAYFVHNAVRLLDPFDKAAGQRRPGKRFLHAKNRGHWPAHRDHVHLRWLDGPLPTRGAPRP